MTSSLDKFIAAPVFKGIIDVMEDSFTIHFELVRKSYNYYVYLYTFEGYDSETGKPIYRHVLDKDTMEYLDKNGMTVEEYEETRGYDSPYLNHAIVKTNEPCQYI